MSPPMTFGEMHTFNSLGDPPPRPQMPYFLGHRQLGAAPACDHFLHVSSTYPGERASMCPAQGEPPPPHVQPARGRAGGVLGGGGRREHGEHLPFDAPEHCGTASFLLDWALSSFSLLCLLVLCGRAVT